MKDKLYIPEEDRVCGACCHFMYEDTDGWGACPFMDVCESMHCSDLCTADRFVSHEQKRHHLAVLRMCQRCLKENVGTKHDLDVKEVCKAINFVVEYAKIH